MYLKMTTIDADILKHESKGEIFLRQFFQIFPKTVQKGGKAQKQPFKDVLGTRSSRKFKKQKKQKKA